jgi:hypothetical protein
MLEIHTRSKDLETLSVIEFPTQICGYWAGESLQIRPVHELGALKPYCWSMKSYRREGIILSILKRV